MKIIKSGGVTTPKGFTANGISAGIKRSGKPDLALIFSETPAIGAAVFTKNSVKAAPLLVSEKNIRNGKIQAIVINSGNANCFTGKFGYLYAQMTTSLFGRLLNISPNNVFVLSTGIIGKPLPYNKIESAGPALVQGLSGKGGHKAAKAILTTDLTTKEYCVQIKINGKTVTIGGNAKGSGMVAPNMATMLAHITTDAAISPTMLRKALTIATDESFNCITVDGCMSTNDTVVVMANGQAGNKAITKTDKNFKLFTKALTAVCLDLSKKIVIDGEGATKFVEIQVSGAKTQEQARTIGLAIANSPLVKTAMFGANPNWGRVAAAVGSVGIPQITEHTLKITFNDFKAKNIIIKVDLGIGKASAKVFTCDLSYDYVKINVAYT